MLLISRRVEKSHCIVTATPNQNPSHEVTVEEGGGRGFKPPIKHSCNLLKAAPPQDQVNEDFLLPLFYKNTIPRCLLTNLSL